MSLKPTEPPEALEIFSGARWDLELQAWADAAHTKPFDRGTAKVEFLIWGESELTLTEEAGITVTPGKEAAGSEPAEPTVIHIEMTSAQTAALDVAKARFLVQLVTNGEPEWLTRGWVEIEGP